MDKKKSEFDKVFSAWDILVIAFGAMIGWGWVVSSGDWIQRGGVLGAMIGFALGGVMIFFVGLTYAELTSAMPQCGGEHVFSYKAMGPIGSFICTWAIILGYVSVVCFEACALPTIITYIYPGFLKGYLYTVAGFDIYASWLAVAILVSIFITVINVLGAKTAAVLQTVLTVIIGGVGILLIASSVVTGDVANLQPQLFVGDSASTILKSIFSVAVVTPFFFIGFDVIPQAAEEINVPLKKIGKILIFSIVLAVIFYALIIFGVGYVMNPSDIETSLAGSGLVTADAMAKAFNSSIMSKVLIVGVIAVLMSGFMVAMYIIPGSGKVKKVGELTKPYGKKALIVTGRSSAKKSGIYDKVKNSLEAAGLTTVLYDKVSQNPLTTTAEDGAAFAKENHCDVVVAIGGGSIMDCAKAIAFLSKNKGDISDYIYNRLRSDEALPLVLIPTTCGTGSEGNGFAVLTNPENGDKKSLRCNAIVAKVSIVDPECMMTMPKKVLASVAFDALCHNIEAYTSRIAQPFTDALSLYAIDLIANNLVDVYNGTAGKDGWEKITLASTIGGMVINTAGVTLAHGMEHPASGLKNIVHGQGLAALTPVIIEASYKGNREKFSKIARIMGGMTAEDCATKIRTLLKKLDLNYTLSDLGIKEEDIPWMAENCMKVSAAGVMNNPVVFSKEEIAEIYRKAL